MITPKAVIMVKPWDFAFNEDSAQSNAFQNDLSYSDNVSEVALNEYERALEKMRQAGIEVISFEEKSKIEVRDAVFPNNWIGFHPGGKVILYPMMHESRRNERNSQVLELLERNGHKVKELVDLSPLENIGEFLEGTGSMVIDYKNKIAYACISPRTSISTLNKACDILALKPFSFHANDLNGIPIYHTNVLLTITEKLAIVCLECIDNTVERLMLRKKLESGGHEILEISFKQLSKFCGNLFEVLNKKDESCIITSKAAWEAFSKEQRELIKKYHQPIPIDIETIETIGGGSARCMVAGVYF